MDSEGLVCVGDSIVNAGRSWGFLLAEGYGWPITRLSAGGATSTQVLDQLPKLDGHHYEVGALTVGTNDILSGWNPDRFEANLRIIFGAISGVCDRVLIPTIPTDLGRFLWIAHTWDVQTANRIIGVVAGQDARVYGEDLYGRKFTSPDRIHPSAAGQQLLAERASRSLELPDLNLPTAPMVSHLRYFAGGLMTGARAIRRRVGQQR